jgi:Trp operon repressor
MAAGGGMAMSVVAQSSHGSTIDLTLTEQERSELRLALRIYVTDLRTEISQTDRYEFREELKAKRAVLGEVLRGLGEATSATAGPEREEEAR